MWRDFKKNLYDLCAYGIWNFKPKISPIFHFDRVNDGWFSHTLWPVDDATEGSTQEAHMGASFVLPSVASLTGCSV